VKSNQILARFSGFKIKLKMVTEETIGAPTRESIRLVCSALFLLTFTIGQFRLHKKHAWNVRGP
jgi:hypothetical protein